MNTAHLAHLEDDFMTESVLVYASREAVPFNEALLKSLLEKARNNNAAKNITGMLLHRDGLFVQALEGEEADIVSLFETIRNDTRHQDVIQIYLRPISIRSFPEWSMGFNRIDESSSQNIEGFSDFLEKASPSFFHGHPSYAKALLDNFRQNILF
jgi:hypothetical protein